MTADRYERGEWDDMESEPADLDERRIYDRILEVCAPIAFTGESFRKSNAAENLKKAAQYLSGSVI